MSYLCKIHEGCLSVVCNETDITWSVPYAGKMVYVQIVSRKQVIRAFTCNSTGTSPRHCNHHMMLSSILWTTEPCENLPANVNRTSYWTRICNLNGRMSGLWSRWSIDPLVRSWGRSQNKAMSDWYRCTTLLKCKVLGTARTVTASHM